MGNGRNFCSVRQRGAPAARHGYNEGTMRTWMRGKLAAPSYATLLIICCSLAFASYCASYMRIPVVPLFAQTLGATTVEVGFINAAFLLMTGLWSFPLGLLSDRLGAETPGDGRAGHLHAHGGLGFRQPNSPSVDGHLPGVRSGIGRHRPHPDVHGGGYLPADAFGTVLWLVHHRDLQRHESGPALGGFSPRG